MTKLTKQEVAVELDRLMSETGKNMETINHYISLQKQEDVDIKHLIQVISKYVDDADLRMELGLHGFCACMMSRLSKVTKRMYGKEVWEQIFGGLEIPKTGWTSLTMIERQDFALSIQNKFASVASLDDYKRALEAVSRTWVSKDGSIGTTKKEVTLSDLDAFIRECNENHVNYHGTDRTAMEEFDSEKWKTRREGSKITVVQIPFLKQKYLLETDEKMKRYYACRCPWVRTSILKGETVSASFCHCSLGYQKQGFETFFGRELDARIVRTVIEDGALECVFEIDIPDDVMMGH